MVSTLALWLVIAAQTAAQADSVPAESAPRLVTLKADRGRIMVPVTVSWKVKQIGVTGNRDGTGTPIKGAFPVTKIIELGDLKELVISTAAGKKVTLQEARQTLTGGGIVVVSSDGRAVGAMFLKVFKDDTLVLVSQELVEQGFGGALGDIPLNYPSPR